MTSIVDVDSGQLLKAVSLKLKEKIKMPEWAIYVKTGVDRERSPDDIDWWYIRAASLLRRIYLNGPVGVSRLRTYYGGLQNRGHKPSHFKKSSGKIIRVILQQLEEAGFVKTEKGNGRVITSEGQKFLNIIGKEVNKG